MRLTKGQLRKLIRSGLLREASDRTGAGSEGQQVAGSAFQSLVPGLTFASIEKGSNLPDLELKLPDGTRIQAEVKSSKSGNKATAFDHTLGKSDEADPDLDPVAEAIISELGADFVPPSGASNGVFKLMNGSYKGRQLGKYRGDSKAEVDPQVASLVDSAGIKINGGIQNLTDGPLDSSSVILGVVSINDLAPGEELKLKSSSRGVGKQASVQAIQNLWPSLEGNKNYTRKKGVFYAVPQGQGPTSSSKIWFRDPVGDYYGMNQTDAQSVTVGPDHPTLAGQVVDLTGSTIRLLASSAGLSYKDIPSSARTSSNVVTAAFNTFEDHLKSGGDQLFVIAGPSGVYAWSVDSPMTIGNVTIKPLTPQSIASAKLAGYGTAGMGQIRLGLDFVFNLSSATKIESLQESTVRQAVKRILREAKDSGTIYEDTLSRGFNSSGPFYCDIVRGKYDLELTIKKMVGNEFVLEGQPKANVEVKYGWGAQLGKFDKKHWSSFTYDKTSGFSGVLADTKDYSAAEWQPIISELIDRLNSSETARNNTDAVIDYISSMDPQFSGVLDLTKKFEAQSPLVQSWPAKDDPAYRQKEVGTDVTIPSLFKLLQWQEKGINYVIIAPRGDAQEFRGWIGLIGSAPPGFNPQMRQMTPGTDLKANIRWVNKGSKSGHTFSLDCKFGADTDRLIGEGMSFASPQDVGYLLIPDYVEDSEFFYSDEDVMDREDMMTSFDDLSPEEKQQLGLEGKRYLRALIREALILEELTKTDKKEIERIAKAQAKKEIERVVGRDFSKTIEKEVQKTLKGKATKQEIADISKSVIKKLYKQLSVNTPQIMDRIKV